MSKYSWVEFRAGAKYFLGHKSPNIAEREDVGYSSAWMHHKEEIGTILNTGRIMCQNKVAAWSGSGCRINMWQR